MSENSLKLKNKYIFILFNSEIFVELLKKKIDNYKVAVYLGCLHNEFEKHVESFIKVRNNILEKYCELDDEKKPKINKETSQLPLT